MQFGSYLKDNKGIKQSCKLDCKQHDEHQVHSSFFRLCHLSDVSSKILWMSMWLTKHELCFPLAQFSQLMWTCAASLCLRKTNEGNQVWPHTPGRWHWWRPWYWSSDKPPTVHSSCTQTSSAAAYWGSSYQTAPTWTQTDRQTEVCHRSFSRHVSSVHFSQFSLLICRDFCDFRLCGERGLHLVVTISHYNSNNTRKYTQV